MLLGGGCQIHVAGFGAVKPANSATFVAAESGEVVGVCIEIAAGCVAGEVVGRLDVGRDGAVAGACCSVAGGWPVGSVPGDGALASGAAGVWLAGAVGLRSSLHAVGESSSPNPSSAGISR